MKENDTKTPPIIVLIFGLFMFIAGVIFAVPLIFFILCITNVWLLSLVTTVYVLIVLGITQLIDDSL
jgi:hypothetical protein